MDKEKVEVSVNVESNSVQESNLILRKLYEELRQNISLGWEFMPDRTDNTIFIGYTNLGEVFLHYKRKGLIDKITFLTSDIKNKTTIENAIKAANDDHSSFLDYTVQVEFTIEHVQFREMAKHQIHIIGIKGDHDDKINRLLVAFHVKAFGDSDAEYIVAQKSNYLRLLLSAYTNSIFEMDEIRIMPGKEEFHDVDWDNYDDKWIDCFYESSGIDKAVLLPDFFTLFLHVKNNDYFEKNMRLILNAAQDFFCALLMKKRLIERGNDYMPGIVDTINTMLLSTLEPLSCIGKEPPQVCPTCGNPVHKISAHIRSLCETYLGEYLAKDIVNRGYKNRSSFLHEGNARTNVFFCSKFYPQIDPVRKNEMLWVVPMLEDNYFDYVSYILRRKIHELLQEPSCLDE